MVLTRKRAAGSPSPSPTSVSATPASTGTHSLQSNLSLLASSASIEAVNSKAETYISSEGTATRNSKPGFQLQIASGNVQTVGISKSKALVSSGPLPTLLNASDVSVTDGGMTRTTGGTVQAQSEHSQSAQSHIRFVSLLPQSATVSPGASSSQIHTLQGSESNPQNTDNIDKEGKQQAGLQYRFVYQPTQPGVSSSGQQPDNVSMLNTRLAALVKPSTSSAAVSTDPTTYTICVAAGKDGGPTQHILVPVSRPVPAQIVPGASLLNPSSTTRPPRPAAVFPTPMPVLARTSAVTLTSSGAVQSSDVGSEGNTAGSASTSCTTLPTVLLPSTSTMEPTMPNSVSQALYQLANTAKADLTSVGLKPSAAPTTATSGPSTDVLMSSSSSHNAGGNVAVEGDTAISWDRLSTLKLIKLYKEHQGYLKDHHYKKKSVWELMATKLRQSATAGPPFRWNHVENKWKNMTKKYRDCIDLNHRSGTSNKYKCSFYDEIAAVYSYCPDEDQKKAAEGLRALKSGAGRGSKGIALTSYCSPLTIGGVSAANGVVITKQEKLSEEELSHSFADASDTEPLLVKKKKYAHVQGQQYLMSSSVRTPKPVLSQPSQLPNSSVNGNENPKNTNNTDIVSLLNQLRADRARQEQARMDRLEQMHKEKMVLFGKFLEILKQTKQS